METVLTAYDLVVVGGGVQGLWVARLALKAGFSVALVEARSCGAGASGGMLGALMPHLPVGWGEKKQFQFEALVELEAITDELTDETGIDTGYVRCGRAMPIRTEGFLAQFPARQQASRARWQSDVSNFELSLLEATELEGWLDPRATEFGVFWDPLAARVEPQRYVEALKASISARCDIFEGWAFQSLDAARGEITCKVGAGLETLAARHVVLAAGYETFELVREVYGLALGRGLKGQAALLAAQLPKNRPILYDDGMYIVAHSAEQCAVGSTTEADWGDATSTDDRIEQRINQARQLCPALKDAAVIGTWAGIRPKCLGRDLIVGRLFPDQPLFIATGGFKITFGIAHSIAARLVEAIVLDQPLQGLPTTFEPSLHLAAANKRSRLPADAMIDKIA